MSLLTLAGALNQAAGTSGLTEIEAANEIAGTENLTLIGALNAAAETSGLTEIEALNVLAGTSGLTAIGAANVFAANGGETGDARIHISDISIERTPA